jgi:hypothetical protein
MVEYLKRSRWDASSSLIGCRPSLTSLASSLPYSSPPHLEEISAKLKQITVKRTSNIKKLYEEVEARAFFVALFFLFSSSLPSLSPPTSPGHSLSSAPLPLSPEG